MTKRSDEPQELAQTEEESNDRLTMAEAARLKGVSYHTVSRAVRRGRLPVIRLGRMALVSAADLRSWRPMRERAPLKYRRAPVADDQTTSPFDLVSTEHVDLVTRMAALYDVIHSAANDGSIEELAQVAVERIAETFDLTRMTVWRFDATSGTAIRMGVVHEPLSDLPSSISLDEAPFLLDLTTNPHSRVVAASKNTGERLPGTRFTRPDGPLLVVPLIRRDQPMGLMFGDRAGREIDFSQDQLMLADGIAHHLAMALDYSLTREQERRRSRQIETMLGELASAVSVFDECGKLTVVNASERKLFNLTDDEARPGQDMAEYLAAKSIETLERTPVTIDESPEMLARAGTISQDVRRIVVQKNGDIRYISTNARPIMVDDHVTGVVAVSRDISGEYISRRLDEERVRQLEQTAERSRSLADLVVEISAGNDAHAVADIALKHLAMEIGAEAGVVILRDEEGGYQESASYGELRGLQSDDIAQLLESAPTSNAFVQYRPILVPAHVLDGMVSLSNDSGQVLIVPLQLRGQRIGAAYIVFHHHRILDESDLAYAGIWGRQCTQAIDKAMLLDQLEFAHGRLMAIIDQLVQAVIILDAPTGEISMSNQAAERLWGRALDEEHVRAETLPVIDDEGEPLTGKNHPLIQPLLSRRESIGNLLTIVREDGAHVDVISSHSPIFDARGMIVGSVSVLQDRADLKPLDRSRDEFISVVAHELRNPLTSLRGNLQLLQRRFRKRDDETSEEDSERMGSIIIQVDRIAELVSRMLDVSRADLGSLDIDAGPCDAASLVRSVITEAQGLDPGRSLNLQIPESLPVVWDAARVQQVLGNLMQNAARYAPESDVDVDVHEIEDGQRIRIAVRDYGPGVPRKIRRRLFKQYYRFDDGQDARGFAADGQRGLGIGLYVSARLARAHGGSLTVDDAEGGGAVFYLELPRDASQSE